MKSIKISIPEPCHEDWNKMTPESKGRFCSSCDKVVYDMSIMTDNEIIKLVESDKKICGRFRNDQLNRSIAYTIPFRAKKPSWAIAASLLVGLSLLSCAEEPVVGELEVPEVGKICVVDTLENVKEGTDTLVQIIDPDSIDNSLEEVGDISVVEVVEDKLEFLGQPIVYNDSIQTMTSGTPYIHEEEPKK
jgi:hypothetical protein